MSLLYDLMGHVATPLAKQLLKRRLAKGKEDPERMPEKLGLGTGEGPVDVWLHAASVGELGAAMPVLSQLQQDGLTLLVTTTTRSSAQMAVQWLNGVAHRFAPLDLPGPRQKFFDRWRPRAMVTIDSEIWPGWFDEARRRGIPALIINGRMSRQSRKSWAMLRFLTGNVLDHVHLVMAQEDASANAFRQLGAPSVVVAAPLKLARAKAITHDINRDHLVMASMHPEETSAIRRILEDLAMADSNIPVCIIPRHPDRIGEFGDLGRNVHFEEAFGQMDHWLARAKAVLVGGSFFDHGGQNPFEAVTHGLRPVMGPSHDNFSGMIRVLAAEDAILLAKDAPEAASMLAHSWNNPWEKPELAIATLQHLGQQAVDQAVGAIKGAIR